MNRICVITGTRADYGLLKPLMLEINRSPKLELLLVVTGTHLSVEFGLTKNEIMADGFSINYEVEQVLSSDSSSASAKGTGLAVIGFSDAFKILNPSMIVVLGDRSEIFAAATTATLMRIPIAHIHGGEATFGLVDEAFRHSVTKMASIHFAATEHYRSRITQLGETPSSIFWVGAMAYHSLSTRKLLPKTKCEELLDVSLNKPFIMVSYHPVTLASKSSNIQDFRELLDAISKFPDITFIFTCSNADAEGRSLWKILNDFSENTSNTIVRMSLGQDLYFSCVKLSQGLIGNSSSGIIEAPLLDVKSVNIGPRQDGRTRASSTIDVQPDSKEIQDALTQLIQPHGEKRSANRPSPYAQPEGLSLMISVLEQYDYKKTTYKRFYDLP